MRRWPFRAPVWPAVAADARAIVSGRQSATTPAVRGPPVYGAREWGHRLWLAVDELDALCAINGCRPARYSRNL